MLTSVWRVDLANLATRNILCSTTGLRIHFLHQNEQDTVSIVWEVNLPHHWCSHYNIMVPWAALNVRHPNTAQCDKGANRKRHKLSVEEMRVSIEQDFWVYVFPLASVSSFKYLGQVLMALDYDCTAVVGNLRKSQKK